MIDNTTKMSLKGFREMKQLTQEEAADLLGISKDTLSNYERGKTYPNVSLIKRFERLYGVTYDQIIFLPLDIG